MELLQIATAYFITKCDGQLLQIATAFLLQSATRFITNCDRYYKVRWLLQIATVQRFYFFRLRLRVCRLGPAYDLMKTRLLESEAEAEG